MAFCIKCGRPLPESGICDCGNQQTVAPEQPVAPQPPYQPVYQQPYQPVYQQPYQQPAQQPYQKPANPNGFAASLMKLPTMVLDYLKDNIATTRHLNQQSNLNHGLAFLLLTFCVNLLASLLPGLVLDVVSPFNFFVHWFITILLGPALGYGIGIGMIYALTSMNKIKAEFNGVLSVVGVSSTLPMALLAVSMILSLIDPYGRVLAFFAVIIVLAWLLSLLAATLQTYDIKLNLLNLLTVIGIFFVAIILIRTLWIWYLGGNFELYLYMWGA